MPLRLLLSWPPGPGRFCSVFSFSIIFIIASQSKINEQYQNRLKTFEFIDMFYAFI